MSIAIMTQVWGLADLSSTQKLVLLSLADNANDHGECYPSIANVAARTCLHERTVQTTIRTLAQMGYVRIVPRPGTSTLYRLSTTPGAAPPPGPTPPRRSATPGMAQDHPGVAPPPAQDHPGGGGEPPKGVAHDHPNHQLNHQLTQKQTRKTAMPEGFGISDRVLQWAQDKGHTHLDLHLEHFLGYVKASGAKYVDWDEALMNAIRGNWAKVGGGRAAGDWRRSDEATAAMGRSLGLTPRAGESWPSFRDRVESELHRRGGSR
jgi:Helix-turn-helix domain